MAGIDRYLFPRGKSGKWQVRLAVPRSLQSALGKKERIRSLKTTDRDEAERLALPILGRWREEEQAARLRQAIAPIQAGSVLPDPRELGVQVGYESMLDELEERSKVWSDDEHDLRIGERVEKKDLLYRAKRRGELSHWESVADRVIEKRGLQVAKGDDFYTALVDALAIGSIEAIDVSVRRAQGDMDASPRSKFVRQVKDKASRNAEPGETLLELFSSYAAVKIAERAKREAGIAQDRMVITQFADFVGRTRSVSTIGYEDAKAYVDLVARAPVGYQKKKDYRGLTLKQAVDKAQREGDRPISMVTHQRYISTLSPFFEWLTTAKGGRRIMSNPFDGLQNDISRIKGQNPRPPFSADQLTHIIRSPLFTGFLRTGREHLPGSEHADDWRKWIPLIAMFTGARISEVAQLRISDVGRSCGVDFLEFQHDEASDQRTKSGICRRAPIHSTLIKIGFLLFVGRRREQAKVDGSPQLFPELSSGTRQQWGDKPSRWWREYLDDIGVDGVGFGSHSFRHMIADQLRVAGYMNHEFGPLIMGHSAKSITGGYGAVPQGTLERQRDVIEAVKFVPIEKGDQVEGGEPVDFSHLFAE